MQITLTVENSREASYGAVMLYALEAAMAEDEQKTEAPDPTLQFAVGDTGAVANYTPVFDPRDSVTVKSDPFPVPMPPAQLPTHILAALDSITVPGSVSSQGGTVVTEAHHDVHDQIAVDAVSPESQDEKTEAATLLIELKQETAELLKRAEKTEAAATALTQLDGVVKKRPGRPKKIEAEPVGKALEGMSAVEINAALVAAQKSEEKPVEPTPTPTPAKPTKVMKFASLLTGGQAKVETEESTSPREDPYAGMSTDELITEMGKVSQQWNVLFWLQNVQKHFGGVVLEKMKRDQLIEVLRDPAKFAPDVG